MLKTTLLVAIAGLSLGAAGYAHAEGGGKGGSGRAGQAKKMKKEQEFKTQAPRAVQTQLEKVASDYEKAWQAHDADKLASFFTEDATYLSAMGEKVTGKEEIRQSVQREHQTFLKNSRAEIEVRSVRLLDPETAIVDAHTRVQGGDPALPSEIHGTVIAKKQGGQWKIAALRAFPAVQPGQMGMGGAGEEGMPPMEEQPMPEPMPPPEEPMPEPMPVPEPVQ